jgi:hypothetical protein
MTWLPFIVLEAHTAWSLCAVPHRDRILRLPQ